MAVTARLTNLIMSSRPSAVEDPTAMQDKPLSM
jgi:hypothetical protein